MKFSRTAANNTTPPSTMTIDRDTPWDGSPMVLATSTFDAGEVALMVNDDDWTSTKYLMTVQKMRELITAGFTIFQTDSSHLNTNEVVEGSWDWRAPDAHLKVVKQAAGKWCFASHFHIPPPWCQQKPDFAPLRCLEHGAAFPGWSIWHPGAVESQERGYRELARQYGDQITALWIGVHGDYGETEYPAGYRMGQPLQAQEWRHRFGDAHNHVDWWCDDQCAREDFRQRMLVKYDSLEHLNQMWATPYASTDDITYPASTESRRHWLDFVHWYLDSITRFSIAVARSAQAAFPGARIFWLLGGPAEDPRIGQDQTALVKAARRLGTEIRSSHGAFEPFAENYASMFKRIASACRHYQVPFWSEPPYTVDASGAVGRIFEAVSCGAVAYYDWSWNILNPSVRNVYKQHGQYLTVEKPVVDVALFFPITYHLLNANEGYPQRDYPMRFKEAACSLRQVFDFDIVDEEMIDDAALDAYRVLVFIEGDVIERSVLQRIEAWIRKGGVAVTYDIGRVETVGGDAKPWRSMFGITGPFQQQNTTLEIPPDIAEFLRHVSCLNEAGTNQVDTGIDHPARILAGGGNGAAMWANPLGEGWAIAFAGNWENRRTYYELLRDIVYHLPEFDPTKQAALAVNNEWNDVYGTLFEGGKVLFYNPTNATKQLVVSGTSMELEPISLAHAHLGAC